MLKTRIKTTVFILLSIGVIFLSITNIIVFYKNKKSSNSKEKSKVVLDFWQKISQENPNYKDAYIAITREEIKMGNFQKAKEYLIKAKELDPNSSKF